MNGWIYLICDPANNTFKIGVTRNIESGRIKKLQTGNCTELHITNVFYCKYPFRLEKMLHLHFNHKKILNEWFELDSDEVVHFKDTCAELCERIDSLVDNPFFMKNIR